MGGECGVKADIGILKNLIGKHLYDGRPLLRNLREEGLIHS